MAESNKAMLKNLAVEENIKNIALINQIFKLTQVISPSKDCYRSPEEFTDFTPVNNSYVERYTIIFNKVDKAREIIPSSLSDPAYDGDCYHIALRHGEFSAQVDKAMAEVYKFFLGYGPNVDILKTESEFYVASRTIKNFYHHFIGYTLESDGTLSKQLNNEKKRFHLRGLASIAALTFFFGESDIHSLNWGLQEQGEYLVAYKIDSAGSLDINFLQSEILLEDINTLPTIKRPITDAGGFDMLLPKEIAASTLFQDEMHDMLRKIADTDFSIIKNILVKNINTTSATTAEWFWKKFSTILSYTPEALSEKCKASVEDCAEFLSSIKNQDPSEIEKMKNDGVDKIIKLLEMRQKQLKNILDVLMKSKEKQAEKTESNPKPLLVSYPKNVEPIDKVQKEDKSSYVTLSKTSYK